MPTSFNPFSPHPNGNRVIQIQSDDRRPPANGAANDLRPVLTPSKMARPALCARIEESRATTGEGILGVRLSGFVLIAHPARQPQILFLVTAPFGLGNDMLHFQSPIDHLLRA
jgi:hypothetical protein